MAYRSGFHARAGALGAGFLLAMAACSGDEGSGGGTRDGGGGGTTTDQRDGAASQDDASSPDRPDGSSSGGATGEGDAGAPDGAADAAAEAAVDAGPSHPLEGSWRGSPCSSSGVLMEMEFSTDRVWFSQSFFNGSMTCFTEGSGSVENLTEDAFEMHGYRTSDNSCNLGIFIGDDLVEFTVIYLNDDKTGIRLESPQAEDYCFSRVD